MPEEISTERLRLATLGENDREAMIALLTDPGVTKTYMVPDLDTEEKKSSVFERLRALSLDEKRFFRGIYLGEKLIGAIHEVNVEKGRVELGYFIDPAEQGRGYCSEALAAVIPYLFGRGYSAVTAAAFSENPASFRVMEKCGMKKTRLTETVIYRGESHECTYYSISKRARASKPKPGEGERK